MEEIKADQESKKMSNGNGDGNKESLAIPKEIIVESIRITKECLDGVVEIVK